MAPLERAMVVSLEQTRHVGVAKSEHPRLTNGEIILEESHPTWHFPLKPFIALTTVLHYRADCDDFTVNSNSLTKSLSLCITNRYLLSQMRTGSNVK